MSGPGAGAARAGAGVGRRNRPADWLAAERGADGETLFAFGGGLAQEAGGGIERRAGFVERGVALRLDHDGLTFQLRSRRIMAQRYLDNSVLSTEFTMSGAAGCGSKAWCSSLAHGWPVVSSSL